MKKSETKTMDAQSKSIQRMYFETVIFSLFSMLLLALYSFGSFYSNAVNNAQTNTIMISVAKRLYDGESVISYDIALNKIQEFTESISLNIQGYIFC